MFAAAQGLRFALACCLNSYAPTALTMHLVDQIKICWHFFWELFGGLTGIYYLCGVLACVLVHKVLISKVVRR